MVGSGGEKTIGSFISSITKVEDTGPQKSKHSECMCGKLKSSFVALYHKPKSIYLTVNLTKCNDRFQEMHLGSLAEMCGGWG